MFRSALSRINRLLGNFTSPRSRKIARTSPPVKFRPSLFQFEPREVPAVDVWLGGDLFRSSSWSLGHAPFSSDDAVFDGTVSNDSLTVPAGLPLTFQSVQLINGYSGSISGSGGSLTVGGPVTAGSTTVTGGVLTLNGATLTTDDLDLTGGVIDQPTSGSDITVNDNLTWTGGTLNSTSCQASHSMGQQR